MTTNPVNISETMIQRQISPIDMVRNVCGERFAGRKIAIVSNAGWNIANFRFPIAKAICREGGSVLAIAPEDEDADRIRDAGIPLAPLRTLRRSGTNPWHDYRLMCELRGLYQRHEIDLAIHYTIKPVIYGSFACGPLPTRAISVVTGLGYAFLHSGLVNRVVRGLYKNSLKRCDAIVFQNHDDFSEFKAANLVSPSKAHVIRGSGVSTEAFQPVYPCSTGENLRFVFVGRLLRDKGIQEFLEASRRILLDHPGIKIDVVGGIDPGNPASMTEEEVGRWEKVPGLYFHGHTSDVRSYLREADVVVLPSYREGLPRSITEAMAMGKPCLTTDVPGCRDTVVDGESGYLVKPYSADAVEAGMRRFLKLPLELLRTMGAAARRRAENVFADDIVLQQYTAIIDASLKSTKRR